MSDKVIFESDSDGVTIQVIDLKQTRHLRFGNGVKQSSMSKKYTDALALKYSRDMIQAFVLNPRPKNILFLGLGGGCLVKYVSKYFDIENIDVVELLPDVIDISKKYFGLQEKSNLNIYNDDAVEYIKSNNKKYDLIFVDIFTPSGMPKGILTDDFFSDLENSLSEDGWISWNTWIRQNTFDKQIEQWNKFFNSVLVIPPVVKAGNVIMFGGKKHNTDYIKSDDIDYIQNLVPIHNIKKDIKFKNNFEVITTRNKYE